MLYLLAERGLEMADHVSCGILMKQLSMKQLEKVLYIAQSTTAGIISRLEQKGLVEGYADAEDKRIKLVRITQAVLKNVLPVMAAMIMVLTYNLADTFFIGQTHNAILIAAVSLEMPANCNIELK